MRYLERIQERVRRILLEENPGLLPDEATWEAERIMYRKEVYERAKYETAFNEI